MNDNKTMKVTDNFMTILLLCFSMYYSLYIYTAFKNYLNICVY